MFVQNMTFSEMLGEFRADAPEMAESNTGWLSYGNHHRINKSARNNDWHKHDLFAEGEAIYTKYLTENESTYLMIPYREEDKKMFDCILFKQQALKDYRNQHAYGAGSLELAMQDMIRQNHTFRDIRTKKSKKTHKPCFVLHLGTGQCNCTMRERTLIIFDYKSYEHI